MRTLVLGLGNPILSDDGVAIHVVRAAAAQSPQENGTVFAEASVGGLRLLDLLTGYERVILVDAIQTHDGDPGACYLLRPGDLAQSLHSGCTHDLSLPAALALGRGLGMELPVEEAITILAIEAQDVLTFGESCTPEVTAALPNAVQALLVELENQA